MKLAKVKIKAVNDETDQFEWFHVCYVDENLYLSFLEKMGCTRREVAVYISKWVLDDFNLNLTMSHSNDILILKRLVKDFYRKSYPHLYIDSQTDRQGWIRTWMTNKMKEELKYYAE